MIKIGDIIRGKVTGRIYKVLSIGTKFSEGYTKYGVEVLMYSDETRLKDYTVATVTSDRIIKISKKNAFLLLL